MFAKSSQDLEFGKKIKQFFALGPVTTVGKVIGAARLFGKVRNKEKTNEKTGEEVEARMKKRK